jgi:diguanylate cyclase (GGDEF)-like protein/PAS domain S-box-containing protein
LAPKEYIGKTDFDLFPEHLASQYFADEQQVVATGVPILNRLEAQDANETVWALTSTVPVKDTSGQVIGLVGVARDISDRQAMETALRTSEERQRALLEAIPDMVFRFDREGVFLDMRVSTQSPYWVAPEQRVGYRLTETLPVDVAKVIIGAIHKALDTGDVATVEYSLERDGVILTFELRVASSGPDEVVAIAHDVTERKRLEQRLAFQATHDPLTGLPNRALFAGRIEQALELAKQEAAPVAVIFVDLDDFKDVNDTYGHAAGDRLLCAVGDRLRRAVRDGDTVARLSGDEFAILLDGFTTGSDIDAIAHRLASRLRQPVRIGSRLVRVTASIGIAIGAPNADDRGDLLDAADRAMYAAKQHGKDRYAILTVSGDSSAHIVEPVPFIPARGVDDRRARARRREIA